MAAGQEASTTNTQILLDKIKADKKLLAASNLDLTDAEAQNFGLSTTSINKTLAGSMSG